MDLKNSLKDAKRFYENAKAAQDEKRYSLNDITDVEFDLLKKMDMSQTLHGTSITVVKSEISNDKQKQSVDVVISILYIEYGKGN